MGFLGQFLARKGGGSYARRGFLGGFLWHFLCTLCPQNSWRVFLLNVMQKAVANFLANVVRVTPHWDLEVDAQ